MYDTSFKDESKNSRYMQQRTIACQINTLCYRLLRCYCFFLLIKCVGYYSMYFAFFHSILSSPNYIYVFPYFCLFALFIFAVCFFFIFWVSVGIMYASLVSLFFIVWSNVKVCWERKAMKILEAVSIHLWQKVRPDTYMTYRSK